MNSVIDATLVDLARRRASSDRAAHGYTFRTGSGDAARLTFAQLDEGARAVAAELSRTVAPGSRALLHFQPGLEFLVGFFGCLYAGVIAVPAAALEGTKADSASAARLRGIVHSARPEVLLTTSDDPVVGHAQGLEAGLGALARVNTDLAELGLAESWSPPPIDGDSVAYLQFSSGSTGVPKGVIISHRNVLHNLGVIADVLEIDENTRGCFWLPMFHDMGLVSGGLMPLVGGSDVTLMSPLTFLQRPQVWLAELSRPHSVTAAPNFAYDHCVTRLSPRHRDTLDLSGLRCAIVGAERVRHATLERFSEAFGPLGFRHEAFLPCYGLAESVLMVTGGSLDRRPEVAHLDVEALAHGRAALRPTGPAAGDHCSAERRVSLVGSGHVRPGVDLAIVDPHTCRPCPAGELGEVLVSGPSVADGYWGLPRETEAAFGARVPGRSGRYFRTGDMGVLLDGELYITGRAKDVVIVDGRNHHASDLEDTVVASHEAIRPGFCAVVSIDDGTDERVVVLAEVSARSMRVPPELAEETAGGIAASIRREVSAVHGVRIASVMLLRPGSLPFTSSGKLQRFACRRAYVEGRLDSSRAFAPRVPDGHVAEDVGGAA